MSKTFERDESYTKVEHKTERAMNIFSFTSVLVTIIKIIQAIL